MEQELDDFRKSLSIDASLIAYHFNKCGESYFLVMLSVIQATGLSDAWANKYLWQNERQEEEERNITADWQENRTGFPSLCPKIIKALLREGHICILATLH